MMLGNLKRLEENLRREYKMDITIKRRIWKLYFDEMYSYEELVNHFGGKYTYGEIKKAVKEKYNMFKGDKNNDK